MALSFEKCLNEATEGLKFSQLAGIYWMCANFNYWDEGAVRTLERRALVLLTKEIEI